MARLPTTLWGVQAAGGILPDGITQAVLCGGFKVLFIPVAYTALIYTISIFALKVNLFVSAEEIACINM